MFHHVKQNKKACDMQKTSRSGKWILVQPYSLRCFLPPLNDWEHSNMHHFCHNSEKVQTQITATMILLCYRVLGGLSQPPQLLKEFSGVSPPHSTSTSCNPTVCVWPTCKGALWMSKCRTSSHKG